MIGRWAWTKQQPQTQYYHTSFEFEGAMAYNKLPETIRSITTVQAFRRVMAHVKC